jgi:hypothetical protein
LEAFGSDPFHLEVYPEADFTRYKRGGFYRRVNRQLEFDQMGSIFLIWNLSA